MAIDVSLQLFSLLGLPCRSSLLSAIFNSNRHIYCRAIFIAAIHFVTVQPDSSYRGFSFQAGPFFCWVAIFALVLSLPYSFCAKDAFIVTTDRCPFFFFAFLVVIILVIFTPSFSRRCSYCHCSTDSNSHTVVLSKPASSIVLCPRKKTLTRLLIFYR